MRTTTRTALRWTMFLLLFLGAITWYGKTYDVNRTPVFSEVTTTFQEGQCEEDEPCWDCETMGNRICGFQNGTD